MLTEKNCIRGAKLHNFMRKNMICEPFLVFQKHFRVIKCVFGRRRDVFVCGGLWVECLPPERETVASGCGSERSEKFRINPTKASKSSRFSEIKILWP